MIPLLYHLSYPATATAIAIPTSRRGEGYTSRRGNVSSIVERSAARAAELLSVEIVLQRQKRCQVYFDKAHGAGAARVNPGDLAGKFAAWAARRLHLSGKAVLRLKSLKAMGDKAANRPIHCLEFALANNQFQLNFLHPGAVSPVTRFDPGRKLCVPPLPAVCHYRRIKILNLPGFGRLRCDPYHKRSYDFCQAAASRAALLPVALIQPPPNRRFSR